MAAFSSRLTGALLGSVAAALTLAAGSAAAAQAPIETRPRIALALSGGGARGLAHVGVLKMLEELRVPVDCITGTSMGAVVGGAYAAGASAAQMDDVVRKVDWNDLFTDRPPRDEMTPRRKQDDYSGYFAPEIGLRNGSLRLAKGVVAGVTIESFLRKLTASAAGVEEFSRLPIPFRAVAADIETGQQVVLGQGSLPLAMRASMAIPGAVNPVEIGGHLLVDGGIANNLPIDLARQTCGDVVIAVNIGTPPMKREEITSALSVVGQLVNFLGKEHVDQQIAGMTAQDVLIKPELGNITAASFDKAADAIRIGEEAARALSAQLRRYSLPQAQYVALRNAQTRNPDHSLGRFDAIEFEGLVLAQPATLLHLMDAKPGVPLDEDTLTRDLRRIYGRGDFDSIDYRIHEQDGTRTLLIRAKEKDTGPQALRFGLSLSTSLGGDSTSTFNAMFSYRRSWVNPLGGELLVNGQIGRHSRLGAEFYQPLAYDSPLFVAPYAAFGKTVRPIYASDQHLADLVTRDARVGVDLGAALGHWGELRIGALLRQANATTETGPEALPDIRTSDNGVRLRIFGDQLDAPWFPRSGHRVMLEVYEALPALGNGPRYHRLDLSLTRAYSLGEQSIEATLGAATSFGSTLPSYAAITLGGPFQLSGYATEQFSGQESVFARLRLMHRFMQLPGPLGQGLYGGLSLEAGRIGRSYSLLGTKGTTALPDTLWSGAAFIGADSFLGPAWLGLGYGGAGHVSLFLSLGVP